MKAFPVQANQNGDFIYEFGSLNNNIGQAPLSAQSVFNFLSYPNMHHQELSLNNIK